MKYYNNNVMKHRNRHQKKIKKYQTRFRYSIVDTTHTILGLSILVY